MLKNYKIILLWLLTILLSCICIPICMVAILYLMNRDNFIIVDRFYSDAILLSLLLSSSISLVPLLSFLILNPAFKRKKREITGYYRKLRFTLFFSFGFNFILVQTILLSLLISQRLRYGGSFEFQSLFTPKYLQPVGIMSISFLGYLFLVFVCSNLLFRKEFKQYRLVKKSQANPVLDEHANQIT